MKLFQTIDTTFSFLVSAQEIDGTYNLLFTDSKGNMQGFSFTEENFLEQFPATDREKTDSMNIYLIATPAGVKLINKYAESYYTNAPGSLLTRILGYPTVGQIYIPFANSPISDWAVRLNTISALTPTGNFDLVEPAVDNSEQGFLTVINQMLPSLEIVEIVPATGDLIKCKLQLTLNGQAVLRAGVDVRATCDSGYIAVRQLVTDQEGTVEFTLRRLDLLPTDPMTVTFGFKLRTNVISVDIPA
jgi:hypothetical protein